MVDPCRSIEMSGIENEERALLAAKLAQTRDYFLMCCSSEGIYICLYGGAMQYMVHRRFILGAVYGFLAGNEVKVYVGDESISVGRCGDMQQVC